MSKQKQANRVQSKQSINQKSKPDSVVEHPEELTNTEELSMLIGPTDDAVQTHAALLINPNISIVQRQMMAAQIDQVVGNQYLQQIMLQLNQNKPESKNSPLEIRHHAVPELDRLILQRQEHTSGNVVEVEVVETPRHPGTVEDIAVDTFRTMGAILRNLGTAIQNFETAISNESEEEASPRDNVIIVMEQIGNFVVDHLRDYATSLVPGGKILNSLVDLGNDISEKIEEERRRSSAATIRNSASNFIIGIRTRVSEIHGQLDSNISEDQVAIREAYANATSEERQVMRAHQERINADVTRMLGTQGGVGALFTRITETWINQSRAPEREHEARVYIKLDKDWNVIQTYLQAPFGSRLAEKLRIFGSLDLVSFNVPRVLMWYPNSDQNDFITNVTVDIPPENGRIENLRTNYTGTQHISRFLQLIRSKPIPETTRISGSQTGT